MDRKKALLIYLAGTFGQMSIACVMVFLLRSNGITADPTTALGMAAVGIGGTSSAVWGAIAAGKYRRITAKQILADFVNIRQPYSDYLLVAAFLLLDFCYVLFGGRLQAEAWYTPVVLFLKAIVFGGIEEIGWRYAFQPVLEEKRSYVVSTVATFALWGIWHLLYFYLEGSLRQVHMTEFLAGLLVNCFILSALYNKTKSLWLCVMAHALLNTLSQMADGGNQYVSFICRVIIVTAAIAISIKAKRTGAVK